MATNSPNYPVVVGLQLKKIRTRVGLTQLEVAQRCGLFRTYVSRIEQGRSNPTIVVLASLAETLNVDIRDLLAIDSDDSLD